MATSGSAREQNGAKPFALTVDSIMRGPELVGNPPNNLRWSGRFEGAVLRVAHPEGRSALDLGCGARRLDRRGG
jgi:hypothetical protein